jgi:alpha-beta hydrolase superfamily lysophospholipase
MNLQQFNYALLEYNTMNIKARFIIIVMAIMMTISLQYGQNFPAFAQPAQATDWYDGFIFTDESFLFGFIRVLGSSSAGGADIGEAIAAAKKVKNGDFYSWFTEWKRLADRSYFNAEKWEKEGSKISAREAYLRASSYYRTAGFYMDAPEDRDKSLFAARKSKECFLKAINSLPYIKPVKIPYEKTTLPGYFIMSDSAKRKAPLVIIQTGFDGTGEELCIQYAEAARSRGYHCLIFEGPGQGSALKEQGLVFRPDWENVVTPVVDWAVKKSEVDKNRIALIGLSFGGYLAPRAVSKENRIKACIANGGIFDMGLSFTSRMPKSLVDMAYSDPAKFNAMVNAYTSGNTTMKWGINHALWVFGANSPADYLQKASSYTMRDAAKNIKCNMLVIDSSSDNFFTGQPKMLFDALKCPKEFYMFTPENAAQAHCQMGALSFSNAIMFNWLDKVMKNN